MTTTRTPRSSPSLVSTSLLASALTLGAGCLSKPDRPLVQDGGGIDAAGPGPDANPCPGGGTPFAADLVLRRNQALGDLDAADAGHTNIQDGHVRLALIQHLPGLLAITGFVLNQDLRILFKNVTNPPAYHHVVIGQQDSDHLFFRCVCHITRSPPYPTGFSRE